MWDAQLLENDPVLDLYKRKPDLLRPASVRLCVDFDHTITQARAAQGLNEIPEIQPRAKEAIIRLSRIGWSIVIHTARFDKTVFVGEQIEVSFKIIQEFISRNKLPVDMIWQEPHGGKPLATWYLDDRSLPPFPGWETALVFLQEYMVRIETIWRSIHPYPYRDTVRQVRCRRGDYMTYDGNVFGDHIYEYGRQQAIADGVLVDLTHLPLTREHFKYPVACSSRIWSIILDAVGDDAASNDLDGILHDIYWMAKGGKEIDASEHVFRVSIHKDGELQDFHMRLKCGPGDQLEPVLTLMLIDED